MLNYSNQYMKPFNDISSVITELQNAAACAGRVFELINEEPEADPVDLNKADGDLPEVKTGSVVFDHVNFSYQADKPLIRDFNLTAKPGMRVALVGPTGCGKTTTINLLMRFYDVDSGGIYLGGRNIKDMSRHALRKKFRHGLAGHLAGRGDSPG